MDCRILGLLANAEWFPVHKSAGTKNAAAHLPTQARFCIAEKASVRRTHPRAEIGGWSLAWKGKSTGFSNIVFVCRVLKKGLVAKSSQKDAGPLVRLGPGCSVAAVGRFR
jgi:hypothetical protein